MQNLKWKDYVEVPEIKTLVLKTVWSLFNRKTLFACFAKKLERFLILRCRLSFFFSEHVCCFDSIESQSYSTEAKAVGGNILKSHQISPHQRPNLLTVHLFFTFTLHSYWVLKNHEERENGNACQIGKLFWKYHKNYWRE